MMATFAGALGRGLAGYGANRERADQRDAELAQQARAEQRQARLDQRQTDRDAAEGVRFADAAAEMKRIRLRQDGLDQKENWEGGYRSQSDTGAVGDTLAGAADVSQGTPFGALMSGLGSYGRAAQSAGKGPAAFTMNGVPMVKSAESLAERTARMGVERDDANRKEDRGWVVADNTQRETRADARDDKNFGQQKELARYTRSLQPRPERQPITQMGNDGNMYYSEDGGRSWQQGRMGGSGPTPSADRAPTTEVPAQRPALDSLPGSGFSRSFQAPEAPRQAAPNGAPQPTAQPPRGVFGNASNAGMSDTEQQDFRKSEMGARELTSLLGQYKDELAKNGTAWVDGGDPQRTALSSLQRQIMLLYKGEDFAKLGVLAGPDLQILNEVISPPTGWGAKVKGTEGITAQINNVIANTEMRRKIRHDVLRLPYQPIVGGSGGRPPLSNIFGGGR